MVTGHEDYRACLEAVAALTEYEADAAVGVLEPLVAEPDCRCLGEAAFLLGVARLVQAPPEETRRRGLRDRRGAALLGLRTGRRLPLRHAAG